MTENPGSEYDALFAEAKRRRAVLDAIIATLKQASTLIGGLPERWNNAMNIEQQPLAFRHKWPAVDEIERAVFEWHEIAPQLKASYERLPPGMKEPRRPPHEAGLPKGNY